MFLFFKKHKFSNFTFFIIILYLFIFTLSNELLYSQQRDRFVFTQLKYSGDWDPYPYVYYDILNFLTLTTSIKALPERRIVTLNDKLLFSSPFIIMLNNGKFNGFNNEEKILLVKFLYNGGTIFIEDSSGIKYSEFDIKIKKELEEIFPDKKLQKLPKLHPVFKSFYLLKGINGRKIVNNYLEGIEIQGRTAIIYSQNDIFGAWVRDKFGNYVYECIPGGQQQRFEAQKLTLNLIVFSLTGTYKSDFIHQLFIEEKLKR